MSTHKKRSLKNMESRLRNKRVKPKALGFGDIAVGDVYSFSRVISQKDVKSFARLTGDYNPLHLDKRYAKNTQFKCSVIHGMLGASLFSTLIGMYCPGKYALLLDQEISYIRPIKPNSCLKVVGEVKNKIDALKVIVLKLSILGEDESLLTEGMSKIKIMR